MGGAVWDTENLKNRVGWSNLHWRPIQNEEKPSHAKDNLSERDRQGIGAAIARSLFYEAETRRLMFFS